MKCQNCGREFKPARSWQKFCCVKCRSEAYKPKARQLSHEYYMAHREEISAAYHGDPEKQRQQREYCRQYREQYREELHLKEKIYRITGKWRRGRLAT